MSWIALHRSEEAEALLERHPNAYLLLTQIAVRARYQKEPCPVTGLLFGQCFIGDFQTAGLPSRKAYRVAKERLLECQFAAFKGASKGTIATLLPNPIYSISENAEGHPRGHQGAIKGPLTNKETKKQGKAHATEAEIVEFVKSIELPASDGEACFHKWVGNGWTNNKTPIKDWKATIRSWKANGYLPSQKYGSNGSGKSQWKTD